VFVPLSFEIRWRMSAGREVIAVETRDGAEELDLSYSELML